MKTRFLCFLAALASVTLSSCGAASSLNQTAGRMLDAVNRTVSGAQ
jgi:hypothetical protein